MGNIDEDVAVMEALDAVQSHDHLREQFSDAKAAANRYYQFRTGGNGLEGPSGVMGASGARKMIAARSALKGCPPRSPADGSVDHTLLAKLGPKAKVKQSNFKW